MSESALVSEAIVEIMGIAKELKDIYIDLGDRFIEHQEKRNELNRMATGEYETMVLINDNRVAIRAAYRHLTGTNIDGETDNKKPDEVSE